MRTKPVSLFLFAVALVCVVTASAPLHAEEPLLVEETFLSVDIKGKAYRLEALVVREAGVGGRMPVAIISHGQAYEADKRERVTARGLQRTAREFARRGWLAVAVVRRGFGRSEGEARYTLRGCRDGQYAPALDDQADDLESSIKAIGRRSDADIHTILALGVSVGGATVLNLAARNPPGLRAVVNVSGGVRTRQREDAPPVTCKPEDLIPLFATLGERSRLPTLWLYAENDSFFPGDYVRQLHEAYVAKGGRTDFHMFEPIGSDGHAMFGNVDGMARWIPALDRFLRANKLPTWDAAPLEAAMKQANVSPAARAVFTRYHTRPTEKAFALSQSGKIASSQYGGSLLEDIESKAKASCEERAKEPCRILLRNFEAVKGE